jgi:hypothetical protein
MFLLLLSLQEGRRIIDISNEVIKRERFFT